MNRLELLNSRGFKDEKHLEEFLETCLDENWKNELKEFFKTKEVEEKPKKSTGKNKKEELPAEELNIEEE